MADAVIFDLDGLLADTERLHLAAYKETLAAHGVAMSDADYEEHWIRQGRGIVDFMALRGLRLDVPAVREGKAVAYARLVKEQAEPMPGAVRLLSALKGSKRLALATASYARSAAEVLDALGVRDYFDCVVAQEDVQRLKPFPDAFLCASERLGVRPHACVVLEDSEKGVRAAHAAGMACIAVPNRHTADHDFSLATRVVPSLDQVTLDLIDALA
jgi:HAD superfamily hydrolase (TIGR01509 family)